MLAEQQSEDAISPIDALQELPDQRLEEHWERIFVPAMLKERLLAQALVSVSLRHMSSLATSLHGLILLTGEPGMGKTTLARGLANRLAMEIGPTLFAEVNPHALPSDLLGQSQRAVSRLIQVQMRELGKQWPEVGQLAGEGHLRGAAALGAGLSGRSLRKAVVQALASRLDTAKDPRKLTVADIESAIRFAKGTRIP